MSLCDPHPPSPLYSTPIHVRFRQTPPPPRNQYDADKEIDLFHPASVNELDNAAYSSYKATNHIAINSPWDII